MKFFSTLVACVLTTQLLFDESSVQAQARPIVDITIQTLSSSGPRPMTGWEFSRVDLNKGVGGKYIYFGWKRGNASDAVTRLGFGAFGDSQQDNPFPDWEWNRSDLNRGAGGAYIYTFWQHNPRYMPIYHVTFIVTSQSSPPRIPGYLPIHLDLNKGAGGPYIWGYISTRQNFDTFSDDVESVFQSIDGEVAGKAVLIRDENGDVDGKAEAFDSEGVEVADDDE